MVPLLAVGAALFALAGYLLWRASRRKAGDVYHFRCPGCDLKLRYGAADEGRRIHCPRCLRASTLNPYAPDSSRERFSSRYRPHRLRRR